MARSPATPSKRRCYPFPSFHASSSSLSKLTEPGFSESATATSSSLVGSNDDTAMLFPPFSAKHQALSSLSQTPSLGHTSRDSNHDRIGSYKSGSSSSEDNVECGTDKNDEDDEPNCPIPDPPSFRRRSTIRNPFDLASSIEDFNHFL